MKYYVVRRLSVENIEKSKKGGIFLRKEKCVFSSRQNYESKVLQESLSIPHTRHHSDIRCTYLL